ncbi:histidinol-phosphate transaminase [Paenibacillus doosanensis]|uniref:Histidinol-phosphate aminotransferase n=1 Tax=Paenibacillus konkukensis TaxID=2020716 RepID=A0ABY4RHJ5_9BACL|nr:MULTISPECIES: histidinol-phosphate transaminase [Paenibacillus]MCS7462484.1 histidinol-phosphate transaminase [Paenibacillus doosanensis]UQZ81909.1 Histidinol-phosphate aminotransferase [Paenibacillus konkukensis]
MQPKKNIVHLPVYKPGKPMEEVKRELGLTEVIKLASNENPFGCSPKAKEAIIAHVDQTSIYPDGGAVDLTNAVAAHFGVEANQVIFGAGSDEIILMLARAYFVPGDETIMASPTFPQYKHNAEIEGAVCIEVPCIDGYHDLQGMLDKVSERTKIIWLCNPNNPTGTMHSHQEVVDFLNKVPSHVLVVLDEAYAEYNVSGQYPDSIGLVKQYKNVITLRTFSKIYGLATLRIGYGIGHPEVIKSINQVREPFNTTGFAQKAALAALQDEQFIADCRETNARGIKYLSAQFDELKLSYYPAHGNFVMVDVERPGGLVFEALLRKGVIVRHDPGWGMPTMLRVTVGSQEQNEKFIGALQSALKEVAVNA